MTEPAHDRTIVFESARAEACKEHALVLRAVGIAHWIERGAAAHRLLVRVEDGPAARAHLAQYVEENRRVDAPPADLPALAPSLPGVVVYVFVLIALFLAQRSALGGYDWRAAGLADTELIRAGEWWRTVTALTLHSDAAHLLGNLFFGGIFGAAVAQLLGNGVGWLTVLLTGAVGGLLDAWIKPPPHASVGASTAVFAALGVAATAQRGRRWFRRDRPLLRWTPLIVAMMLLGWLGVGGPRTDVLAHATGFVAGLAAGLPLGTLARRGRPSPASQTAAAALALGLLGAAWALALD